MRYYAHKEDKMRYISHISNLVLYTKNGAIVDRFDYNGVLVKGDGTTNLGTGNQIDVVLKSSTPNDETMRVYTTDLLGNSAISEEMCGLGNLASLDLALAGLDSLQQGYNRNYFEAAVLTSTTDVVSDLSANIYYEVLTGTTIYDGTTYTVGQVFYTDGSTTATTGTGTFALTIPPALNRECQAFRPEHFKIKSLLTGNESSADWSYAEGFAPRDNMTTDDPDYFAYTE